MDRQTHLPIWRVTGQCDTNRWTHLPIWSVTGHCDTDRRTHLPIWGVTDQCDTDRRTHLPIWRVTGQCDTDWQTHLLIWRVTDHGAEMYTPCPIRRVTYHCDRNVHTLPHQKGDRLLWYNAWIHLPHCDRDVCMFSSKGNYTDMWPWVTCRVTGLYDRCTHLAWPCRVWLVWQGCTYLAWPAGSQGWLTSGAAQRLHDPCHQLSDHWSSGSCPQPAQATQQPHAQCSTPCTKSGNVQLPLVTSTEHFIILMTSSKAQIIYIYMT